MSDPQESSLEADIAGYRQPMVTSIGIIMGFLLSFLANWAVEADEMPAVTTSSDWIIAVTLIASIMLFSLVLFRLLNNRICPQPGQRYQLTLRLYMCALVLAFAGLSSALFI